MKPITARLVLTIALIFTAGVIVGMKVNHTEKIQ